MIRDPETARAHADLTATLQRMDVRIRSIGRPQQFTSSILFRADQQLQREIAGFMRREGLENQAEAIRRLVKAGLEAKA